MRELAPLEPRSSGSCLRGAACVRQGQQTRLLQNLFKDWWKPLRRLPGEVPADEERAQPSGARSRPPSLPPSLRRPRPSPAPARGGASRPCCGLGGSLPTPGISKCATLIPCLGCWAVADTHSRCFVAVGAQQMARFKHHAPELTRCSAARQALAVEEPRLPPGFTHASPGPGPGRRRAAGGRQRWGLLPWGHALGTCPGGLLAVGACLPWVALPARAAAAAAP